MQNIPRWNAKVAVYKARNAGTKAKEPGRASNQSLKKSFA
jgi:hypothetical protein